MPTDMGGSGGAIDNRAPGLALNYLIALQGVFPSQEDGSAPEDAHYLGEIIVFAGNTVPNGYARCEGQLLQISQNTALFALIGTQYGGDGRTTFALPDFRGRVAVGSDPNEGFDVGMTFGSSQVTLTSADMPPLTLNGGAGDDILYGGGSGDTLSGNDGADQLRGGAGGDTLNGGAGDDLLLGGSGADALNGDAGNDTVSYATSGAGVIARLGQVGIGGDAQGDTFTGIEKLIGSAYADELRGSGGANRLEGGQGDDVLNGRGGADQLIGGSGSDTASYANAASGVIARLDGGAGTGEANGDVYDSIENLTGSNHNDTLTGSAGVNRLNGGDGDDVLTGGAGGDELNGGTGTDTASYATSASGVTVRLDNGQASGGDAEGDTFSSIEHLVGSDHADSLRGNIGVNRLSGGAGDDVLVGRGGADVLNGGTGADTASYVGSAAGVTVQLDSGLATGGEAEGDVLSSIENLTGSDHNDSLRGNGVANRLAGGDGDDVLNGRGGADILSGGSGTDTATYVNSAAGVVARLDGGASTGGEAEGDTFSSIENLTGSAYDDLLIGSSGANSLVGGGGSDRLVGGGGDDTLTGGGGADRFDFRSAGGGQDIIADFAAGGSLSDVIWLSSAVFTDYADVLAHTTDDGLGNTVISKGGVHITLTGVLKAQLRSNDFDIAAPAPLLETAKDLGPQVLPDEADAKTGLFSDDDAIICPVFEDGQAADVDTVGDDGSDPDPLVLPFDVGPKAAPSVPIVCDTGAGPDDPGHPIAFVTDTEALLSERGPNRIMSQPTWIDWVW
ncbi:tail fiber protein [Brevundimonas sp.]|uniref:tail fiber protein n=1 Tax=Brevundimonas sp. TaxID=1871086 RepID=UPI0034542A2C